MRASAFLTVIATAVLLLTSAGTKAQYCYDGSGRTIGRIDGKYVYDGSGKTIGRLDGNFIYDGSGRTIGRVDGNYLYDGSGRTIGRVDGVDASVAILFYYFYFASAP